MCRQQSSTRSEYRHLIVALSAAAALNEPAPKSSEPSERTQTNSAQPGAGDNVSGAAPTRRVVGAHPLGPRPVRNDSALEHVQVLAHDRVESYE
jgi:hypothetical protein